MWKKGIYHGDISLENLMWDDRRKVGVLNDFDLAKFAGQAGASGQDNTGTLPFMALDLLSEEGLRGEIPRRYRHEAESFAWSLICLYYGTVEDWDGKNCTRHPHPLAKWFGDWETSLNFKKGLDWRLKIPGIPPAHPNTRDLACALHEYWMDRFTKQFPHPLKQDRPQPLVGIPDAENFPGGVEDAKTSQAEEIMRVLNPTMTQPLAVPPYEEPEDENLFRELVVIHARELANFEPIKGLVVGMGVRYNGLDWVA